MEKVYVVETNRHAKLFILATNKKEAENAADEYIVRFTRITEWNAETLPAFLKKETTLPKEYWLSRAREYVVDAILLEMECAIAERYEDESGAKTRRIFKIADDYVTKNFPDLEPPFKYDVMKIAKQYLTEIGELECAEIIQREIEEMEE